MQRILAALQGLVEKNKKDRKVNRVNRAIAAARDNANDEIERLEDRKASVIEKLSGDTDVNSIITQLSDEYLRFGINEGKYITGLELSDLIRMNRSCFESKQKAMELVTIMRNFKAKVTTQIEASDDKKGNRTALVRQVVEGNQPPSFELFIPIFKGQPKQTFTVEIDIDPDTLQATLVSPDAQDIIAETSDQLIDEVLAGMERICPEIPIIEI
jgi:hypothetical protein